MVPGRKAEGWESIVLLTFGSCFLILTAGMSMKSDDSFKGWARREAQAREQVVENGGTVEFGKYYQVAEYEQGDEIDVAPKLVEKQ